LNLIEKRSLVASLLNNPFISPGFAELRRPDCSGQFFSLLFFFTAPNPPVNGQADKNLNRSLNKRG
jgi:hypothetical protein